MPKKSEILHLLLVEPSENEVERIASLFRNSGQLTQHHQVQSEADLFNQLQDRPWQLLIARPSEAALSLQSLLTMARQVGQGVPIICLADPETQLESLRLGVHEVVAPGDDEHLLLAAQRAIGQQRLREQCLSFELRWREAEKRCQLLLDSSKDAITYIHEGMHIYANAAYAELFGYDGAEDLAGLPIMDLITSDSQGEFRALLRRLGSGRQSNADIEVNAVKANGEFFTLLMELSSAIYEDEPCTQLVIHTGHGEADLQAKLQQIRAQDTLTGLFNKDYFLDRLQELLQQQSWQASEGSLVYLQLDEFEKIRTHIGVADVDLVLRECAELLKKVQPKNSILARFGETVFTFILQQQDTIAAEQFAKDLLRRMRQYLFEVAEQTVQLSASIGLVCLDGQVKESAVLLAHAHRACAKAQARGGNHDRVYIYDPAEFVSLSADEKLIAKVRNSIVSEDLSLVFQPIISLQSHAGEYYEALVRLLDDQDTEIPAAEFLPLSETDLKLCNRVDRWVILQATKLLGEQRRSGADTRLLINLSSGALLDKTLVPWVGVALKAAQLQPAKVVFQFRVKDLRRYLKPAREFLKDLTALGCLASIAGVANHEEDLNIFNYLQPDLIKLSATLMEPSAEQDLHEDLNSLVRFMLGKQIRVIAPLVESASVVTSLWQARVDFIQGYYLQAPGREFNYDFGEEEAEA